MIQSSLKSKEIAKLLTSRFDIFFTHICKHLKEKSNLISTIVPKGKILSIITIQYIRIDQNVSYCEQDNIYMQKFQKMPF
jgi:hypothetical protein